MLVGFPTRAFDSHSVGLVILFAVLALVSTYPLVFAPGLAFATRLKVPLGVFPLIGALLGIVGPFLLLAWWTEGLEGGLGALIRSRDAWPWVAGFALGGAILGHRRCRDLRD